MSDVELNFGHDQQTKQLLLDAIVMATDLHRPDLLAWFYNDLAFSLVLIGEFSEAAPYIREAMQLARQQGNLEQLAGFLDTLGHVNVGLTKYSEAHQAFMESLSLLRKFARPSNALSSLTGIAKLWAMEGREHDALAAIECVLAHPDCSVAVARIAQQVLMSVSTQLPPGKIATMPTATKELDLETFIADFLAGHKGHWQSER
jgi:tetratricopeptide (TPR) repeat protein